MDALVRSWWLLAVRGVRALIFGLAAIFYARITPGVRSLEDRLKVEPV